MADKITIDVLTLDSVQCAACGYMKAAADEIHLLSITASFGVTGFSPRDWKEGVKPEALLQLADILLYEAKEAGRDQVNGRLLPAH